MARKPVTTRVIVRTEQENGIVRKDAATATAPV
jgi:hypothetical protein